MILFLSNMAQEIPSAKNLSEERKFLNINDASRGRRSKDFLSSGESFFTSWGTDKDLKSVFKE
jgi:hypothetical protein